MALTFYGTKLPRGIFETIQNEVYALTPTLSGSDGLNISFTENHKSGTEFTNVSVSSNMIAYNPQNVDITGAVPSAGNVLVSATIVNLVKAMMEPVTYDPNELKNTRFERDIKAGALNVDSPEFQKTTLANVIANDSGKIENSFWNGATAATKTAVAAATTGTAAGNYTAGEKALVAAMPTALFDSIPTSLMYNNNQDKTVQAKGTGKGDYNVANITPAVLTSSNVAAKFQEVYASQFAVNPNIAGDKSKKQAFIVAYGTEALINGANNTVGAATNQNFINVNGQWTYNGINIYFRALPAGVILLGRAEQLHILTDSKNDATAALKIGKLNDFSDLTSIVHIFAFATFIENGKYITAHLI